MSQKRGASVVVVFVLVVILQSSLWALTPAEFDFGELGIVKFVEGALIPEVSGRFDKLVLVPPTGKGEEKVLFETEGRILDKWEVVSLGGSGSKQLLLTLDPGGNGGFKEFALLASSDQGLVVIWEETMKMGVAEVKDVNGDQKPDLVLTGTEMDPATGKVGPKTMEYTWKNGHLGALSQPE